MRMPTGASPPAPNTILMRARRVIYDPSGFGAIQGVAKNFSLPDPDPITLVLGKVGGVASVTLGCCLFCSALHLYNTVAGFLSARLCPACAHVSPCITRQTLLRPLLCSVLCLSKASRPACMLCPLRPLFLSVATGGHRCHHVCQLLAATGYAPLLAMPQRAGGGACLFQEGEARGQA